jgi:hypothetical protein
VRNRVSIQVKCLNKLLLRNPVHVQMQRYALLTQHITKSPCHLLGMHLFGVSIVLSALGLTLPTWAKSVPVAERNALAALQEAWLERLPSGGFSPVATWPLHNLSSDPCQHAWFGIDCYCPPSTPQTTAECAISNTTNVIALSLSRPVVHPRQLFGTLADVLLGLPYLHSLDLSNQALSGPLPHSLFTHPVLKHVRLEGNFFAGPLLPESVAAPASALFTLNVRYNMLSGPVNASLCSIPYLHIEGNSLLCESLDTCHLQTEAASSISTGAHALPCLGYLLAYCGVMNTIVRLPVHTDGVIFSHRLVPLVTFSQESPSLIMLIT